MCPSSYGHITLKLAQYESLNSEQLALSARYTTDYFRRIIYVCSSLNVIEDAWHLCKIRCKIIVYLILFLTIGPIQTKTHTHTHTHTSFVIFCICYYKEGYQIMSSLFEDLVAKENNLVEINWAGETLLLLLMSVNDKAVIMHFYNILLVLS